MLSLNVIPKAPPKSESAFTPDVLGALFILSLTILSKAIWVAVAPAAPTASPTPPKAAPAAPNDTLFQLAEYLYSKLGGIYILTHPFLLFDGSSLDLFHSTLSDV